MESLSRNDAELVDASLNGDRKAFGQIVERYQSLICAVTYSRSGNMVDSEDIAQETFLTAWQRLADLRDRTLLRAWLCGIAQNQAKNLMRRRSRDVIARATPLDPAISPESPAPSPRDNAIGEEEESILWRVRHDVRGHQWSRHDGIFVKKRRGTR